MKKRATYQDVVDAPDDKLAEIINGELVLSPRPGVPHTRIASVVGVQLGGPFDAGNGGPGGWIILDEPELHLAVDDHTDVFVPDLAAWRRERLPALSNDSHLTLEPDWICEVLSKSTEATDRLTKMPAYGLAGVRYAWLIHAGFRSLEVFELHEGERKWLTTAVYQGDVRARIRPFEAIELDLSVWWRDIPQPDRASEGVFAYEYGR